MKRQIPAETYEEQVALMEMVMEVGEIAAAVRAVREDAPAA